MSHDSYLYIMASGDSVAISGMGRDDEGRIVWEYVVRNADAETVLEGTDMRSGVGSQESAKDALETFASFVAAWVDAVEWSERNGRDADNVYMFPATFADWAREHAEDLALYAER